MTRRDAARLERLHHVRSVQERAARAEWAAAEARARDAEARAQSLSDTLARARAELDELLRQRTIGEGELASYEMPLSVMEGHLAAARAEAEVRLREAAEEQRKWSACERDRRAVERLDERERERQRVEREALEERSASEAEAERFRRREGLNEAG